MKHLRDLLHWTNGTGFVLLGSLFRESASGHVETSTETYACRINGRPHRICVSWTVNFYKVGTDFSLDTKEQITEKEYVTLTAGKPPIDTPEERAKVERYDNLLAKIDALTPACPRCKTPMTERMGREGRFWGCRHYPNCRETCGISIDYEIARDDLSRF